MGLGSCFSSRVTRRRTASLLASRACGVELTPEELAAVDHVIPPGTSVTDYCTLYDRMCRAMNKPEPLSPF